MINYVKDKFIDLDKFSEFLKESHQTNQFTNRGPAKRLLERKLEQILDIDNSKSVLCTSNGTLALHAIYFYLNKKFGNIKFASPSYTFPSCVVGFNQTDLLDIELDNFTIPLTQKVIDEYDAFIITNLFGTYPGNIYEWVNKCKLSNKLLIFDSASSPMTKINGVNICNFGDFSFGSLHHTKFLGFGEGGFIVLPTDLYDEFEKILGFGFSKLSIKRVHCPYSSNYKMSDVTAASILQNIERYNLESHIKNQSTFIKNLSELNGVKPFNYKEGVFYGNMSIIYDKPIDIGIFRANNIEAQKYYYPLENHKNSLFLFERMINIPLYDSLSTEQVDYMTSIVKESLK